MKNLKAIMALFSALSLMFVMGISQATTFQFENITRNGNTDLTGTGQLTLDVTSVTNGVEFTFFNDVGVNSSITSIYFDAGLNTDLFDSFSISRTVGDVLFSFSTKTSGDPNYPNLPGGNTINFDADVAAGSPGSPSNGVDNTGESITFLALAGSSFTTFDDFINKMLEGSFRAGFHLTAIDDSACYASEGPACGSDSYVSAVPVPAAAWLFGTALFGFFAASRRKNNS